jgi:predicted DNA binding protein
MKTKLPCTVILCFAAAAAFAQKKSKTTAPVAKSSDYFYGKWEVTNFSVKGKNDTTFYNYTSESNGCYEIKNCNPKTDKVAIVALESDSTVLDLYWRYEKGGQDMKFAYPDTLFMDHRVYVADEHNWVPYKIKFISKDEFIINDWRWENCTNRFVRVKEE